MKLMAKLAKSQLATNRSRSFWTLAGIALATSMITAVFGFVASLDALIREYLGETAAYIDMYNETFFAVGGVFATIIAGASIAVVSNAFRVSASERSAQFGMLKSVGATRRQIAQSVVFEGLYLCVIGIPAGILLGFAVNLAGVGIINYFLAEINILNPGNEIIIRFVFSLQAVLLSVLISFFTVLISAWMPARRASRIPAVDAIRGVGEIKPDKQPRGKRAVKRRARKGRIRNAVIMKLFGFEGVIAAKTLKRNRRSLRTTVISLAVSVTLLIIVWSFGFMMQLITEEFYLGVDATLHATFNSPLNAFYDSEGNYTRIRPMINSSAANEVTQKMRAYGDTPVFATGTNSDSYRLLVPVDMLTPKMRETVEEHWNYYAPPGTEDVVYTAVTLTVVDPDNYERLCAQAGVPVGSNILVNRYQYYYREGGRAIFAPFIFDKDAPPLRLLKETYEANKHGGYDFNELELKLHGQITMPDIPAEVLAYSWGNIVIIVPDLDANYYNWFASPEDKEGFTDYAFELLDTLAEDTARAHYDNYGVSSAADIFADEQQAADAEAMLGLRINTETGTVLQVGVTDIELMIEAARNVERMIMTFIYGFVGMLTLIGLTNVISTISANTRARAREFAVLRSAGMTPGGLNKMLNLESALCSSKSLMYGIPLGVLGSYLIHRGTVAPVDLDYSLPWVPIIRCTLGVFLITWVTMRYAASRIRGGSIVEAIRSNLI